MFASSATAMRSSGRSICRDRSGARPSAGAPTIHVTGTAFIGSVEVKVVNPNAPSWIKMLRTRWNEARGIGPGQP